MTDYMKKSFTVALGSDSYRDNWDKVFGKGAESPEPPKEDSPPPLSPSTPSVTLFDAYVTECEAHEKTLWKLHEAEKRVEALEAQIAKYLRGGTP